MSIELQVNINNNITPLLNSIKKKIANLPTEAYNEFYRITPKKTGYAKQHTKLHKDTIKADYDYAEVLDKGRHMTTKGMRGSKQAPKGMTKPTIDYVKRRLAQIVRGK